MSKEGAVKKIIFLYLMVFSSAQAGDFKWCKSVAKLSFSRILNAHVPTYPPDFEEDSNKYFDGEWIFNLPLEEVWRLYTTTPISKAWGSRYIVNRFTLPPGSKTPIDKKLYWPRSIREDWPNWNDEEIANTAWPTIQEGTRIYLDIKGDLIGVFCNMAIGFEITKIVSHQSIEFQYLNFSPPYGKQWIHFIPMSDGRTKVRHLSQYLGKNWLVEHGYMFFHKKEIPLLHEQMLELAKKLRSN